MNHVNCNISPKGAAGSAAPRAAADRLMASDRKTKCPLISNPRPECYCFEMNSAKIPKAIQFCLNDFTDCEIFKRIGRETTNTSSGKQ